MKKINLIKAKIKIVLYVHIVQDFEYIIKKKLLFFINIY